MGHEPSAQSTGVVRSIAYRPADGDPMQEIDECRVLANRGLDIETRKSDRRNITILSKESWDDACGELGKDIPWWTRRANLLVEGFDLGATIGQILKIGPVRVQIHDETRPCHIMDAQHTGLTKALLPERRGGVFGQVLGDGVIRTGDEVRLANADG
jgi:MOSC domain-containing protein YiiM